MLRKISFICIAGFALVGALLFFNHAGVALRLTNYLWIIILFVVSSSLFFGTRKETQRNKSDINFPVLLLLGLLIVPSIGVFKSFWSADITTLGDAPHFTTEEIKDLISEPYAWTTRGENMGGVDPRIYIWPILFVFGLLGNIGLSSEFIVLILFYLPAITMSLVGPFLLTKYLGQSRTVGFFASLVYLYNTYFLLLVDGGQVGVALAYGFFPLVLYYFIKLVDKPNVYSFLSALSILMLSTIADIRISLLAFVTLGIWMSVEKLAGIKVKTINIKFVLLLFITWLGMNAYWIYPLVSINSSSISTQVMDTKFTSLLSGLTLFAPHWPNNIFGEVNQPFWFFILVPIMLIAGVFVINKKGYKVGLLIILIFTFFTKGSNFPFGGLYSFLTNKIPFGVAFRDSTKFFVPIALFLGISLGQVIEAITSRLSSKKQIFIPIIFYLYFVYLISPALSGKMNFVLSGQLPDQKIASINKIISNETSFNRTAWFPERHPTAFETEMSQALDAKYLAELMPLSNLTAGSSDKFNYVYPSEEFIKWYQIFGIKYLALAGDARNKNLSDDVLEEWERLNTRLSEIDSLKEKYNALYEVNDSYDEMYAVDKISLVVGPMLEGEKQYAPAVYFEDAKLDPLVLEGIASHSASIVFNKTDEDDLTMSFLKNTFIGPRESDSQWAMYDSKDYLLWKYQLLIRNVASSDFDYGLGVAFSDKPSETLQYRLDVPENSDYILAIRTLGDEGSKINVRLRGVSEEIIHSCLITQYSDNLCRTNFRWYTKGVHLEDKEYLLTITNLNGTNAVNAISLVPTSAWNDAKKKVDTFIKHFGVIQKEQIGNETTFEIPYTKHNPTWYSFTPAENANWIVLNDSYHTQWKLKRGVSVSSFSLPLYSVTNIFYVKPEWKEMNLRFVGQEKVRWGLYYSFLATLLTSIVVLLKWQK